MEVLVFEMADYANVAEGGKLNIMGVFREISAFKFPARHPRMHLVIKLGADMNERGENRQFTVKLVDADANEIMAFNQEVAVPEGKMGMGPQVNIIMELRDIVFPQPGAYEFILLVDKDLKGKLQLLVNQMPQSV